MGSIVLHNLTVSREDHGIRLRCSVSSHGLPDELWFLVKGLEISDFVLSSYNWAVIAMLLPAMCRGDDLVIQGRLSARLFTNVNNDLQAVLRISDPRLNQIRLKTEELNNDCRARTNRVGTGFSAGVDSFATLLLFAGSNPTTGIAVTDLCTFNVGAMGAYNKPGVAELFKYYCDRTKRYARTRELKDISVDSNISDFYTGLGFQKTHTFRNIAAALALEGVLDYYLYSSAVDFRDIRIAEGADSAYMDPILLPLLSTENLTFISAGAGLSRYKKTALIAGQPDAQSMLDVCVEPAAKRLSFVRPNCSRCWKCSRVLISLESLGLLENFEQVFDLEYYQQNKKKLYAALLVNALGGNQIDREVVLEAKAAGLRINVTPTVLIRHVSKRMGRQLKKMFKTLVNVKCL